MIVAALSVAFLGKAFGDDDAQTVLSFGGGIALVIAALALFVFLTDKPSESKATEKETTP